MSTYQNNTIKFVLHLELFLKKFTNQSNKISTRFFVIYYLCLALPKQISGKKFLSFYLLAEMECEISQFGAGNSKTMQILLSNHPSAWNFNAENWYLAQIEHTQPTKVLQSSLSTRTHLINVQETCQNKREWSDFAYFDAEERLISCNQPKYSNLYNKRAEGILKLAVRFWNTPTKAGKIQKQIVFQITSEIFQICYLRFKQVKNMKYQVQYTSYKSFGNYLTSRIEE